ncbi:SEP-domain-containing protein [Fragilariopsis cylindrus CCMP1102]|uniref:SEP-domain-containing protein n=1 Tax=Fragilariopsis cylindrus CCMP1102 TaxID=635003 RepID=A0A1E7FM13_9STRA|nr:SEP-domain-containing protein [Fragilariopsis cylindrus CCMP1102]|eukprot:OEU19177.1 SEP-domain-containing protein [Fragilariopsis cylindrus CCMP1102]
MSNIRGLYDDVKEDTEKEKEEKRRRDANNRYVGGVGAQGGGSGLAVEPNNNDDDADGPSSSSAAAAESIFNIAERAGQQDDDNDDDDDGAMGSGQPPIRRTITMYANGFLVDDGPYRRLDDPANADFLTSLARGQTPSELRNDGNSGGNNITVGLIDKRKEDYIETFRYFSGEGNTLRSSDDTTAVAADGTTATANTTTDIFDPSSLPSPEAIIDTSDITSIAVRMLDGSRKIIKISCNGTVEQLAALAVQASNTTIDQPFRIIAGYPPTPLLDPIATITQAGLQGSQIQLQKL